jgi:ABC-type microcin C transport system permease subunit YejB
MAMDWTNYIMTVVVGYPAAIIAAFWAARTLQKKETQIE